MLNILYTPLYAIGISIEISNRMGGNCVYYKVAAAKLVMFIEGKQECSDWWMWTKPKRCVGTVVSGDWLSLATPLEKGVTFVMLWNKMDLFIISPSVTTLIYHGNEKNLTQTNPSVQSSIIRPKPFWREAMSSSGLLKTIDDDPKPCQIPIL